MSKTVVINGITVTVVYPDEKDEYLTESEKEMDYRAVEAVKAAIHRAQVMKKPVARYDREKETAYLEYPDRQKVYPKNDENLFLNVCDAP